jgi:hypothetical protein
MIDRNVQQTHPTILKDLQNAMPRQAMHVHDMITLR